VSKRARGERERNIMNRGKEENKVSDSVRKRFLISFFSKKEVKNSQPSVRESEREKNDEYVKTETSLRFHTENPLALSKYYGTIKLDICCCLSFCAFTEIPSSQQPH
jgi:hypothetical protein